MQIRLTSRCIYWCTGNRVFFLTLIFSALGLPQCSLWAERTLCAQRVIGFMVSDRLTLRNRVLAISLLWTLWVRKLLKRRNWLLQKITYKSRLGRGQSELGKRVGLDLHGNGLQVVDLLDEGLSSIVTFDAGAAFSGTGRAEGSCDVEVSLGLAPSDGISPRHALDHRPLKPGTRRLRSNNDAK